MSIHVTPLANMGAEVTGLDLSVPIPPETKDLLRRAWYEHAVLVFREAAHSPAEQLRLSHVFGESEPHTLEILIVPDERELIRVSGEAPHEVNAWIINGRLLAGYLFWHQDESYTSNIPQGSMLRMTVPTVTDGQTGYLDIRQAYRDLPDDVKDRIDGLETVMTLHGANPNEVRFGTSAIEARIARPDEWETNFALSGLSNFPQFVHKLIVEHPYTHEKTMLLSPLSLLAVRGMDKDESNELLQMLTDHVLQEKYMYFHSWRPDDVVLWDNWNAMHCAQGYPPDQPRAGFRTTIKGPTDFRTGRPATDDETV